MMILVVITNNQYSCSVPEAVIEGGSEVHVESGSTLNLTCVVKHSTEQPHYLLWYHKDQVQVLTYKVIYINWSDNIDFLI